MDRMILLPIAHGTEETEAVTVIDLLRRAGLNVTVAGESEVVICSRGIRINPDRLIDDIDESEEFGCIVFPGGATGVENLLNNHELQLITERHTNNNTLLCAICAAPTILAEWHCMPKQTRITSHPSVASQLAAYQYSTDDVVTDGNIITSRGVGTAIPFALAIITHLTGSDTANRIAEQIVYSV